jgi:GNAT superfamily N-acetyltransferase
VGTVVIREFRSSDTPVLTELLHRAYAELGASGLNFTAVDQSDATTEYRASAGHCLIAIDDGQPIATLTMSLPASKTLRSMFPAADSEDVAWLNQMAVDPERRGTGLARTLWLEGLAWAIERGATTIGVDTALPAEHLIRLYEGWGFERAGVVHWDGKTYDSAVLLRGANSPVE